ncbi:MAG: hypothetical protein OEY28_11720, partial [Nitrospira sp.]|nr:hypothetical protein [Nitrospira sp.]
MRTKMAPGTYFLLITSVLFGSVTLNIAAADAQGRGTAALSTLDRTPHVPNQVLVQFRVGVTDAAKDSIRDRIHAESEGIVAAQERRKDMKGDLELWNLPPGVEIAHAVRNLQQEATIEFAE